MSNNNPPYKGLEGIYPGIQYILDSQWTTDTITDQWLSMLLATCSKCCIFNQYIQAFVLFLFRPTMAQPQLISILPPLPTIDLKIQRRPSQLVSLTVSMAATWTSSSIFPNDCLPDCDQYSLLLLHSTFSVIKLRGKLCRKKSQHHQHPQHLMTLMEKWLTTHHLNSLHFHLFLFSILSLFFPLFLYLFVFFVLLVLSLQLLAWKLLRICNEIVPTQPSIILIVISLPHYTLVYISYMVQSMFLSKEMISHNLGTN